MSEKRNYDEESSNSSEQEHCEKKIKVGDDAQVCNYCFLLKSLVPGKRYCASCGRDRQECPKCRRPLDQRFISENGKCHACNTKRRMRTSLHGCATIVDVSAPRECDTECKDPIAYTQNARPIVRLHATDKLQQHAGIKYHLIMTVKMGRINRENEEVVTDVFFHSSTQVLLTVDNFDEQYEIMIAEILRRIDEFIKMGSGWYIKDILCMDMHVAPYKPISPSSFIDTPGHLIKKKCIINIKNPNDELCFAWSILAALFPVNHNHPYQNKLQSYKDHLHELNLKGLKFPLAVSDVRRFEKQNERISVNVFAYDKRLVYPVYVTSFRERPKHVNLLLLSNERNFTTHYTLITSMSRLLSERTKHDGACYYCDYCLHGFRRKNLLNVHIEDCRRHGIQKTILPNSSNKWLKFTSVEKQLQVPVVIYCDFESYTSKIQRVTNEKLSFDPYELHEPSGYAFCIVWQDNILPPVKDCYHGSEHVIERFLVRLKEEYENIEKILSKVNPLIITDAQRRQHNNATHCYLCSQPFHDDKVIDHSHLTGLFRGSAHRSCNLKLKYQGRATDKCVNSKKTWQKSPGYTIPVIFHNLQGYDGHLIIKGFKKSLFPNSEIKCIPNSMEKYLSFQIGNFKFLDSYQFLSDSLEKLVSNLSKTEFNYLSHFFPGDKIDFLLRKGVFPYNYWDGPTRLEETQFHLDQLFTTNSLLKMSPKRTTHTLKLCFASLS